MPPKKHQGGGDSEGSDGEESQAEESQVESDLRKEIQELHRKLSLNEELRERQFQDAAQERNILVHQYQDQIKRITTENVEKNDEIRNLMTANDVYRNVVHGLESPRKGRDVPMPRQILFDGKGTWESFAKPFRALVESCKWKEDECLFRLQSSLRGEAAEYAFNQTTAATLNSYSMLMVALETRYKERRTSSSYLAELESRKLQPKEKLAEYVSEIRKLVIKGYPTADDVTRETINIRHFIKGLQDQQAALHIGMKDPKTIEEARTILETYNSLRDEVKGGARLREVKAASKPTPDQYVTESRLQAFGRDIKTSLGKKIDSLATQINQGQSGKEQKGPGKTNARKLSDVVCFKCSECGHYAKNCPNKEKDRNDAKNRTN